MLEPLMRASIDGAVMVTVIWTVSRFLPRLPAAIKAALWWCVAAKFLVTMAWGAPVVLAVLPAPVESTRSSLLAQAVPTDAADPAAASHPRAIQASTPAAAINWTAVAGLIWLTGVALSGAIGVRRWRHIRTAAARAVPAGPGLEDLAADISIRLALRRVPAIRLSPDVDSPLVTGLRRPEILIPAGRFERMTPDQQRMAVCHEMAHIQRGDLWLGCLPAMAERIFFFHPLVRLAVREYGFWREAACDAAVLRALGTAPQAYGRLLLDLGISNTRPVLAASGAAWSFSTLKRRIVMLRDPSTPAPHARVLAATILAVTVVAIAPLRLGARPTIAPPDAPNPMRVHEPATEVAPAAAAAAVTPQRQSSSRSSHQEEVNFVYMRGKSTTMSGDSRDIERVRSLRTGGEDLLWFRRNGREYVVRDPAVLKQMAEIWAPVSQLGEAQGEVGARQGELGAKQGELGAQQGVLGAQQGTLGARQGMLGAEQGRLAVRELRMTDTERRQIEQERRAIEDKMRDLEREMAVLSDKMAELDEPMRKLGAEMERHGEEMDKLGVKMEAASRKAEEAMLALITKAIASGAAQEVR